MKVLDLRIKLLSAKGEDFPLLHFQKRSIYNNFIPNCTVDCGWWFGQIDGVNRPVGEGGREKEEE